MGQIFYYERTKFEITFKGNQVEIYSYLTDISGEGVLNTSGNASVSVPMGPEFLVNKVEGNSVINRKPSLSISVERPVLVALGDDKNLITAPQHERTDE